MRHSGRTYFPVLSKKEEKVLKTIIDCFEKDSKQSNNISFNATAEKVKILNSLAIKDYIDFKNRDGQEYQVSLTTMSLLYFDDKNTMQKQIRHERLWTFIITLLSALLAGLIILGLQTYC